MKEGVVPPTINLDNPDVEAGCDLDYVPNVAHRYAPEEIPTAILSDNLGFGKDHCKGSCFVADGGDRASVPFDHVEADMLYFPCVPQVVTTPRSCSGSTLLRRLPKRAYTACV